MSHASICPSCRLRISVPEGLMPSVIVVCPLCDEEFSPGEASPDDPDGAVATTDLPQAVPRNLSPLPAFSESATGEANEFLEPVTTFADAPSGGDSTGDPLPPRLAAGTMRMVRCPCCQAEYPIGDILDAATGTPWGARRANSADDRETVSVVISSERPNLGPISSVAPNLSGERKRKRGGGFLGEIVQVILGGIVGLSVTYYGLNYFGGPQFDYLKVFLPGVPHTYSHRPAWWPEWLSSRETEEP